MLRAVNRVLLGLAGLILFGLGGAVLIGGLDLRRHWGFSLPKRWPFDRPGGVLLTNADRTHFRSAGWWWPVVFAVLGVLLALLLWWLLAQLRPGRLAEVVVDSGDGVGARLSGTALAAALAAEAEALDGVSRARVALIGRRRAARARIRLLLEAHADPGETLARLSGAGVRHARQSAGLDRLPTEARLKAVRHRPERVL
ncbi:alkaline shock response membrane anchor protein AmaP [Streptomyces sp. TP-A0874]|uniref:alkaline shock response membrane anchor protein AmaP n=1 Tax=Streptomyces sp. TP-A0874 TaxID=549819 RepID=UPI0008535F1C|nr:alkaline shock response membrane anchor protein AmaP [Streptomyces sp. TP-A0874]